MFKGRIYNRECEMQGGPYTLLVFKEEFDLDLPSYLIDLYNKQIPDMEGFLKVAWAMCKTCNDDIPYYEHWLEDFDNDTFDIREGSGTVAVIDSAINAELFCERQTLKERIIFRIVGWLLSRRRK